MIDRRRDEDILHWEPGDRPLQLFAWFTNQTVGYFMHWGDGSISELNPNNARGIHDYELPGAYHVRAKTLDGRWLGNAQVVVRPSLHPPATIGPYPRDPELFAVTFDPLDSTGIMPRFRVNWRDGKPGQIQEAWGLPGESLIRYLATGKHIVSIYELTANTVIHHRDINIDHSPNPDFELAVETRTVTLTVTKADDGKTLAVDWGDTGFLIPVTGTTATHTYPSGVDTTYLVQLWYADASSFVTKPIAIQGGSS